jgi:hypothetical protein
MASLDQTVTALRARLAVTVQAAIAGYARDLATVIQTNPGSGIGPLLERPDIRSALAASLAQAQQRALGAVAAAWQAGGHPGGGAFHAALAADVRSAYGQAAASLEDAARSAFASVAQRTFTVGVSEPGTNPEFETAQERAREVRQALLGAGSSLATRNGLSVSSAATRSGTEAVLAEGAERQAAGEVLGKRWVASMNGRDPRSCYWCRQLHGTVVPLGEEFPYPQPAALPHHRLRRVATAGGAQRYGLPVGAEITLTRPPRVYLNLLGPGLHPHCRCRIELVPLHQGHGAVSPLAPEQPPQLVSSAEIAALPEDRYAALVSFLRAALHELSQMLRRLLRLAGGSDQ